MRSFIRGSAVIIVTGMLSGCGSTTGPKTGERTATPSPTVAYTNACVMPLGGANVLRVMATADAKCVAKEGSLHINGSQGEVEIWLVAGAATVDAAIAQVPQQIVSEFKDFKTDHTTDLTIAGSPAKRLTGSGEEADDGDPGHADIIVFKAGDHVFVACTHGENLSDVSRRGLLALVQSAQVP